MPLRTNTLDFDELTIDPAAPADGQVWHNNTTGQLKCRLAGTTYVIAPSVATASAVLVWGVSRVGTTTSVRYLTPGYEGNNAQTVESSYRAAAPGTYQNMRVRARVAGTGAATLTYVLMVNGVPSALSVAMSNTVQDGADLANTVAVAAGDLVSIRITKSAGIAQSPRDVFASLEVV